MVLFHHGIEDMKEFMGAKTNSHDVGPATEEKEVPGTHVKRPNSVEFLRAEYHLQITLEFPQSAVAKKGVFKYKPADNISDSSYKINNHILYNPVTVAINFTWLVFKTFIRLRLNFINLNCLRSMKYGITNEHYKHN